MPIMTNIWIELNNPVRSFFPSQTISGVVVVVNEKAVETTGLRITFDGKAKVSWSERMSRRDGGSRRFVSVFYTSEEKYFHDDVFLYGDGKREILMTRGKSTFPFQFTLPDSLPSSFVSRIGTVSYNMEASLLLPYNRSDPACIIPFTINGVLDLNLEPGASLSLETRKYKSVCCFCCRSGPVGFVFSISRRGYVPGEVLEFAVDISNSSTQKINGMKVTLMQVTKFHAEGNSKELIRPIRTLQGPEVDPGDTEVWVEKMLRIPPIPPTRLAQVNCPLIDVQYHLKVEMALSNLSLSLKEEVPITIGTIPLRTTFPNFSSSSESESPPMHDSYTKPSMSPGNSNPGPNSGYEDDITRMHRLGPARQRSSSICSEYPSFVDYPDLPPPTYQEAMLFDKSQDASEENQGFSMEDVTSSGPFGIETRPVYHTASAPFVPQYVTYGPVEQMPTTL